jgi:hypothetical protein
MQAHIRRPEPSHGEGVDMSAGNTEGTEAANGNRLRCNNCGSEAIVTKAGGSSLTCCGAALEITFGR